MTTETLKKPTYLITRRHLAVIMAFAVLLILPAAYYGSGGDDLHCISLRSQLFAAQFWHGDLYPRWLQDMYAGYGSPVFFYYPPLAFYITAFFAFLTPLDAFGYTTIAASALLSLCVAGIAFYIWMRKEGLSAAFALIGSLLYIAAPDNMGNNFYYWLLFSSVWAYAWVPLYMLSARQLALGKPYGIPAFACTLCLLILTHLPDTMIFAPIGVAYSAWILGHSNPSGYKRWLARITIAIALGFGLSAVYLVPALSYMEYVYIDRHWTLPESDYHAYFLVLGFRYSNQIIYTVAWLAMVALTLAYSWILYRRREKHFLFFSVMSLIALCMILPLSRPIWEFISPLKILQFPERFFTVPALCLAVLASAAMPRLRLLNYGLLGLYSVLTFMMADMDMRHSMDDVRKNPLQYESYRMKVDQYSQYFYTQIPFERQHTRFYTLEGLADVKQHREKIAVISGDAITTVDTWTPRGIGFHYRATQDSVLRIRQFYFPGFAATLDGHNLPIHYDDSTAAIIMELPAGGGEVTLQLTRMPPEIAGMLISILSAGAIAIALLLALRKNEDKNTIPDEAE